MNAIIINADRLAAPRDTPDALNTPPTPRMKESTP